MADGDIGRLHAAALQRMLAPLPYQVFLGEVKAPDAGSGLPGELEFPYLVLWVPPASRPLLTMNGYGGEATTTTQITAAGRDVDEVITALDRASTALHRRRPTITGRRCGLITQTPDEPPPPQRDESNRTADGRPVFFTFARFSLFSASTAPAVINHP